MVYIAVCQEDPPTNPGVEFSPILNRYNNRDIVMYSCVNNGILFPSPAANLCVGGVWIYAAPMCYSKYGCPLYHTDIYKN